jgi:solute:Na+ symporter, SSS family
MIFHYFPSGLLGLAMTAVMASFMSGMAANVTSFNTVWTYDIYQRGSKKTDAQLLRRGKIATVADILLAICCAYVAVNYNNIMSLLQLVCGFVNAPLFATFLLGIFTRRSNSTGLFLGLVIGTPSAVVFHGLSFAVGNPPGVKGAWIRPLVSFPKEMSQGFWVAIVAFSVTFIINLGLSLASGHRKPDEELRGLVYSLTLKERRFWRMPSMRTRRPSASSSLSHASSSTFSSGNHLPPCSYGRASSYRYPFYYLWPHASRPGPLHARQRDLPKVARHQH